MPVAAPAVLAAAAASVSSAPAPPVVDGARLVVAREEGAARAELVLQLSSRPRGLELRAVEHGATRLVLLAARLRGARLPVAAVPAPAPARIWRAAIDGVSPAGPAELTLSYRVLGAFDDRPDGAALLVPLVLPALRGAPARPGLFQARLPVPHGHSPWDTFPSVPVELGDGAAELSLPVLPGLVRLESGPGPPPLWTPGRLADGLTLGALAALGAIGVRALRRSAETARE